MTAQLALAVLPTRAQVVPGLLNVPARLLENVTVPVGVRNVPAALSVTVTVHVVSWLTSRFTDVG
jgi:hypothetical protein